MVFLVAPSVCSPSVRFVPRLSSSCRGRQGETKREPATFSRKERFMEADSRRQKKPKKKKKDKKAVFTGGDCFLLGLLIRKSRLLLSLCRARSSFPFWQGAVSPSQSDLFSLSVSLYQASLLVSMAVASGSEDSRCVVSERASSLALSLLPFSFHHGWTDEASARQLFPQKENKAKSSPRDSCRCEGGVGRED